MPAWEELGGLRRVLYSHGKEGEGELDRDHATGWFGEVRVQVVAFVIGENVQEG